MRIFVDLDGVLVDWIKGAFELFDLDLNDPKNREIMKKPGFNFEDEFVDEQIMWEKIESHSPEFWENLEPLPWAHELWHKINKEGDVCILTSPGDVADACSGKARWIKKHLDTKRFLIGKRKWFCAFHNTILIDDNEKKCKQFIEEGGHAFHWPEQTNLQDGDISIGDTIDKIIEKIRSIQTMEKVGHGIHRQKV